LKQSFDLVSVIKSDYNSTPYTFPQKKKSLPESSVTNQKVFLLNNQFI